MTVWLSMTDKTQTLRKMYEYASERALHLVSLKLLFPSIFCWYFRYFVSETYIFSGLQLHLHTYTINAVSFSLLMVWHYNINDSVKSMYMRASLEILCIFTFKTAISFNILLVLQKLCRYKWHRLTCTDRFPNVPTKLRKSIMGPPPPIWLR